MRVVRYYIIDHCEQARFARVAHQAIRVINGATDIFSINFILIASFFSSNTDLLLLSGDICYLYTSSLLSMGIGNKSSSIDEILSFPAGTRPPKVCGIPYLRLAFLWDGYAVFCFDQAYVHTKKRPSEDLESFPSYITINLSAGLFPS